jgi:hypothetical protein
VTFKKFLASFALMTVASFSYGQATSTNGGSIQGTIADPSGAAIPNATVVITDPDIGYSRTVKTDGAGFYSVGPLVPGSYTVSISAANLRGLRLPRLFVRER